MTLTSFNDMVNPSEILPVLFLFIILSHDKDTQSDILARMMDFTNQTDKKELLLLF